MMDTLILCNATAVSASIIADEDHDGPTFDRLVTLAVGCVQEDGAQEMVAGIILTPAEARELASELLTAATEAEGVGALPVQTLTDQPVGRC
ncbi:hypothetical protein [Paracoccus hibiscisoli]|uniref:Uncharacterized protein n=1 Tax=Paracoccus hibiscisoli TaxID=2023261 RepID=A0A4U0RDA7_9RHOB|nr:hypothetical protein [Paracoccus hibiscisoli]TJZ86134.1 hypothetical protein FA740_04400 [Paracoccus hibiscisoli]